MLLLRSSTKKSEDVMKVHAEERLAPQCDRVGFKCLHYEVSEGDGHVSVVVVNKLGTHLEIGQRAVEGGGKSVVPRLEYRQKVALSRLNAEPMLLLRSSTKKS